MPVSDRSGLLFDFRGGRAASAVRSWETIGDPVMGGVSRGELVAAAGHATFRGEVSLARGGGFASVRTRALDLDLTSFEGLELAVRGDGARYTFNVRDRAEFDTVLHRVAFAPPAATWSELRFPFDRFEPTRRGRRIDVAPLDPARVRGLGLMISGRQAGPFRLDVAWIAAFGDRRDR